MSPGEGSEDGLGAESGLSTGGPHVCTAEAVGLIEQLCDNVCRETVLLLGCVCFR